MDRFNEWQVSAYVLPTGVKFVLLYELSSSSSGVINTGGSGLSGISGNGMGPSLLPNAGSSPNLPLSLSSTPNNNTTYNQTSETDTESLIRGFFTDCHEHIVKSILNPFYTPSSPVISAGFDKAVRRCVWKYFIASSS